MHCAQTASDDIISNTNLFEHFSVLGSSDNQYHTYEFTCNYIQEKRLNIHKMQEIQGQCTMTKSNFLPLL